jgi:hypothetical protein
MLAALKGTAVPSFAVVGFYFSLSNDSSVACLMWLTESPKRRNSPLCHMKLVKVGNEWQCSMPLTAWARTRRNLCSHGTHFEATSRLLLQVWASKMLQARFSWCVHRIFRDACRRNISRWQCLTQWSALSWCSWRGILNAQPLYPL